MLCRPLVLFFLLACALGAQARDQAEPRAAASARQGVQRMAPDTAVRAAQEGDMLSQQEQRERQRRREVLREALRVQTEATPATARQMSAQERLEMRQQLRQQQEWTK